MSERAFRRDNRPSRRVDGRERLEEELHVVLVAVASPQRRADHQRDARSVQTDDDQRELHRARPVVRP